MNDNDNIKRDPQSNLRTQRIVRGKKISMIYYIGQWCKLFTD